MLFLKPKHLSHPKYRPDIDGMRAVAVWAVVGFHAFPQWVRGGFIGVDIFFVISGFLISTIIFESLDRGAFSFIEFYARRINRIFPALIAVLAVCFAFGWFALLSDEYRQLGKHIAGGAGFVSNLLLLRESGYFDNAADTKPLLHLWSLGIEEQFYIVWPFLLWIGAKKNLNLLMLTILMGGISFALNIHAAHPDSAVDFYSPQTRFWELMIGAALAHISIYHSAALLHVRQKADLWLGGLIYAKPPPSKGATLDNLLALTGVALIAAALLSLTKESRYPYWYALSPTLGAALIIAAGPDAWFNRRILSHKILVWTGLISFPLYLWHWPLLSFARIIESETPSRSIRVSIVIASVVLAALTYILVERPIRFGPRTRLKAIILILAMLIMGAIGADCFLKNGFGFRSSIKVYDAFKMDVSEPTGARQSDGSCSKLLHFDVTEPNWDPMVCLTNSASPDILILGDSHAMALNNAVYYKKSDLKTLLVAANGCLPFEHYLTSDQGGVNKTCHDLYEYSMQAATQIPSIKTIVVNTRGPLYFDPNGFGIEPPSQLRISTNDPARKSLSPPEMFADGYADFIASLLATGKKVIFFIDVPEMGIDPKSCMTSRPFRPSTDAGECTVSRDVVMARQSVYRKEIQEIKRRNPAMGLFDPMNVLCDSKNCYGRKGDAVLYWDENHPSVSGSELLLGALKAQIGAGIE